MDELAATAAIDAHVRGLAPGESEEQQIAGLQIGEGYRLGAPELVVRATRNDEAHLVMHILDQTAAVKALAGRCASVTVGGPDELFGQCNDRYAGCGGLRRWRRTREALRRGGASNDKQSREP